jgi:hypothetical protein
VFHNIHFYDTHSDKYFVAVDRNKRDADDLLSHSAVWPARLRALRRTWAKNRCVEAGKRGWWKGSRIEIKIVSEWFDRGLSIDKEHAN